MEIRHRCQTPPPSEVESSAPASDGLYMNYLPIEEHQLTPYSSPVALRKSLAETNETGDRPETEAGTPCPSYYYHVSSPSSTTSRRQRLNSWGAGDLTPTPMPMHSKPTLQIVSPSAALLALPELPTIPALLLESTKNECTPRYSSKRKQCCTSSPTSSTSSSSTCNKKPKTCSTTTSNSCRNSPVVQPSLQDLFVMSSNQRRQSHPTVHRGLPKLPDLGEYPNAIEQDIPRSLQKNRLR